jgi:hypothetical protein
VALFHKIISNRREIRGGGGNRNLGGRGWDCLQINNAGALFAIRQERERRHYLRCGVRVGVRWPIYRATLLVSTVLIQPIPIIFGVRCIRTTDTKDTNLRSRSH